MSFYVHLSLPILGLGGCSRSPGILLALDNAFDNPQSSSGDDCPSDAGYQEYYKGNYPHWPGQRPNETTDYAKVTVPRLTLFSFRHRFL